MTCAPGPNAANYERFRALAGAHLIFDAFWKIQHFSVHQMLMRDPMHEIDLGAIVQLIRAPDSAQVSRVCRDKVDKVGLAAKKNQDTALNLCWLNATALTIKGNSSNMCHAQPVICNTVRPRVEAPDPLPGPRVELSARLREHKRLGVTQIRRPVTVRV